jgi:hypothetical protein
MRHVSSRTLYKIEKIKGVMHIRCWENKEIMFRTDLSEEGVVDLLHRWINGEMIQNVFPFLTNGQREILITGIDDEEWDEIFKDVEIEDEES